MQEKLEAGLGLLVFVLLLEKHVDGITSQFFLRHDLSRDLTGSVDLTDEEGILLHGRTDSVIQEHDHVKVVLVDGNAVIHGTPLVVGSLEAQYLTRIQKLKARLGALSFRRVLS